MDAYIGPFPTDPKKLSPMDATADFGRFLDPKKLVEIKVLHQNYHKLLQSFDFSLPTFFIFWFCRLPSPILLDTATDICRFRFIDPKKLVS